MMLLNMVLGHGALIENPYLQTTEHIYEQENNFTLFMHKITETE